MTITDPFTETIISDPYAHAHELAVRPGRDADEVRLDATGHGRTVTIVVPAVELRAALDRAAAQEPTDAELDALYDAFMAHSEDERSEEYTRTEGGEPYHERICSECGEAVWIKGEHYWAATRANGARKRHHVASAALSAARAARRDEENR